MLGEGGLEVAATAEDVLAQRAGILGVQIDLAAQQRLPDELRAAHLSLVGGITTRVTDQVAGHLAENYRLGELFRADVQYLRRFGADGRRGGEEDEEWPE